MEELRTTETLDREILEDARKKAHKILKTADDTLAAQSRDWEKKTLEALDSIRKVYAGREKKTGEEILARLPLDKRRLRSETAEGLLVKATDDFLRSLKRETLLAVLERELSLLLEDSAGEEAAGPRQNGAPGDTLCEIVYSGLKLSEARAVFEKAREALPENSCSFAGAAITFKENTAASEFPSLIINTEAMKISASLENAAAALLRDKRAELAAALLGEGVLND